MEGSIFTNRIAFCCYRMKLDLLDSMSILFFKLVLFYGKDEIVKRM